MGTPHNWTNGGGDGLWSNPLNWNEVGNPGVHTVPSGLDEAFFGFGLDGDSDDACLIDDLGDHVGNTTMLGAGDITLGNGVVWTAQNIMLAGTGTIDLGSNPHIEVSNCLFLFQDTIGSGVLHLTCTFDTGNGLALQGPMTLTGFTELALTNSGLDVADTDCVFPSTLNVTFIHNADSAFDNENNVGYFFGMGGCSYGTVRRTGNSEHGLILDQGGTIDTLRDDDGLTGHNLYFTPNDTVYFPYVINHVQFPTSSPGGKAVGIVPNWWWYSDGVFTLTSPNAQNVDWAMIRRCIVDVSPTWTAGDHALDNGANVNWLGFNQG